MSMSGSGSGSSDNEPSAKKLKFLMSESESESELESENSDNESLTKKPKNCAQDFYDKEFVKSAIDDDIQEAIRKAKLFPRLTVDQYTCLLIEMVRGESQEWLDLLLTKAVETIDIASYGLDASSIEDLMGIFTDCSAYEELYRDIEFNLLSILICKKTMVQSQAEKSVMPFDLLFKIEFLEGPSSNGDYDSSKVAEYRRRAEEASSSVDICDLITVAELRRKAEGSRFITRDHFLWAFDQGGCGLRTAFKDELASRMAAEGHPPYHIYGTALTLANAEQQLVQAEHLAFAVVFGKNFDFSEEEVNPVKLDFLCERNAGRLPKFQDCLTYALRESPK
ncbi:uncharacterized protein LOC125497411 isoform X2 [Beta vulgaris subsp. vulgaris]|uniref:uncharacterized protein LOC125497411 isoform X2 n=1 Tax=Beta vulgaris subsp. vulgaris TaxID=3555 RepID=UPI0025494DEA|nr:uncharacterized protein LOC125497411 isoform X2 [Beta vulgaris subsp. vulgaris]